MIIYGKNPIMEAIRSKRAITNIYVQEGLKDQTLLDMIKKGRYNVTIMPVSKMTDSYGNKTGGVVAIIEEYQYKQLNEVITKHDQENVTFVMLDGLEDPHNLGAILRSVDATLMDCIIIPKNRSVSLNATVAKVSTGAIEYVDVVQVTNLVQTINDLKKLGFWVIGLELDGSIDYRKQDYHGKIVVVIGSEGKGISRLVKENCDMLVNIPMYGKVNSLNASVSAGILFYEIIRNRGINE